MLEADKYPTIAFKSTGIEQKDLNHFVVSGELTMRGVTKPVQIPLEFGGLVSTRMGPRAGFSGNLTLNKDRKSTRLNSSHRTISYTATHSLHDALPIYARGRQVPDHRLQEHGHRAEGSQSLCRQW